MIEVETPLGFVVRVKDDHWKLITTAKHPVMAGRKEDVADTLKNPDEVRQSKTDPSVFLFYKTERADRWLCAVAKRMNAEGFLIITYPTDAIKEGKQIWPK